MEVDEFCRDLNGVLACCDKCRDPFADGPFHDVLHFHHAIIMMVRVTDGFCNLKPLTSHGLFKA